METSRINSASDTYVADRKLETKFAGTIKGILGKQFITQSIEADLTQGIDFAIFRIEPFSVAARLRRYKYYVKYKHQFTIRWSRPSGVETEIDKVNTGLVDYFFYGFVDEAEKKIIKYFIADLGVFRQVAIPPFAIKLNDPPDSELGIWRIADFPPEFILKSWPVETGQLYLMGIL